jgi:hypothetical protein
MDGRAQGRGEVVLWVTYRDLVALAKFFVRNASGRCLRE